VLRAVLCCAVLCCAVLCCAVVGHPQCGEAVGAIAKPESLPLLEEFARDERKEVSETCALAVSRLRWSMEGKSEDDTSDENPYHSVDPAPAEGAVSGTATPDEIAALRARLMDADLPLFKRYRAMFSLRNIQSTESVLVRSCGAVFCFCWACLVAPACASAVQCGWLVTRV